jgi:hypothetical protein
MSLIQSVVEYEDFAILKDNNGSFITFRDRDTFESIDDDSEPMLWPKSWKEVRMQIPDAELVFFD